MDTIKIVRENFLRQYVKQYIGVLLEKIVSIEKSNNNIFPEYKITTDKFIYYIEINPFKKLLIYVA